MKAEITEDQFCEYIVAQLKKYAWRLAREGKLSWIDRSDNSNFAVVKNHATCDTSLTYHDRVHINPLQRQLQTHKYNSSMKMLIRG